MKKNAIKRALFYTSIPRLFRTTLIGHLYEIAQVYPVVLLSEKLDPETEKILTNRKLFPKLQKIIPVRQFTEQKMNLLAKNRHLYKLAKDVIRRYKPDIVIAADDIFPFEMYLMRFAKRTGALNISIQPSLTFYTKWLALWTDLTNAYLRFPLFLPLSLRILLVKIRKHFGHFLYYWALPLTVGEKPFFGKSSYILIKGNSGMRDADYNIVFSKRDYNFHLKDGVPAEKLYILVHPLKRETRDFFEKAILNTSKQYKINRKIATLMWPEEEIGFKADNYVLISKEEKQKMKIEIVRLVARALKGWKIFIKPHPNTKNINKVKENLESLSDNIKIVDPQESADKYIEMADVIIGLPMSASTTIFTASLQCPDKPILSLDLHQEILGDYYKDFDGVEYIDSKEKLINILELVRDNKYYKQEKAKFKGGEGFQNVIEMLNFCLAKKNHKS